MCPYTFETQKPINNITMKEKLLQVVLYADSKVYVRDSPQCGEIIKIMLNELINKKCSQVNLLFKYYNITLKQIEYQYVGLNRLKTKL